MRLWSFERIVSTFGSVLIALYCAYVLQTLLKLPQLNEVRKPQVLAAQSSNFETAGHLPNPNTLFLLGNQERFNRGLPTLRANGELEQLASQRAQDMIQRHYYGHKNPDGLFYFDYFRTDTFKNTFNCENLNLQFTDNPEVFIQAWLESNAGHRECMLHPELTDVGYAVAELPLSGGQIAYVVVAIHTTKP
jgi:uncharacterized protein YkwD